MSGQTAILVTNSFQYPFIIELAQPLIKLGRKKLN